MEIRGGERGLAHGHRGREEMSVEGALDCPGRKVAFEIEVNHLTRGVDAGVGAPRSMNANDLSAKGPYRPFEGGLNRRQVALSLKARERASIIFDNEPVARHDSAQSNASDQG